MKPYKPWLLRITYPLHSGHYQREFSHLYSQFLKFPVNPFQLIFLLLLQILSQRNKGFKIKWTQLWSKYAEQSASLIWKFTYSLNNSIKYQFISVMALPSDKRKWLHSNVKPYKCVRCGDIVMGQSNTISHKCKQYYGKY